MSLAKDEGSSHRKGKEVTADDPLAKTMVEETLLSESDHSKKEEGGRDPNSECLPPHRSMVWNSHSLPRGA